MLRSFVELALDPLGLIGGDKAVFDQQVGEAALVGIGRLLLLLAAEFDFGLRSQAGIEDDFPDLGIEVGDGRGISFDLRHVYNTLSTKPLLPSSDARDKSCKVAAQKNLSLARKTVKRATLLRQNTHLTGH